MMKQIFIFSAALSLSVAFNGCSKKDADASVNPPDATSASQPVESRPAPATTASTPTSASLQNVTASIQQGNYDAAVDGLVTTKASLQNLSEADRAQFQQQVRNATTALLSAKANDPKAAAAYKRLSESMTGR